MEILIYIIGAIILFPIAGAALWIVFQILALVYYLLFFTIFGKDEK